MKCDPTTTRMLSHASYHGSSIDIAVIWRCASRTTIYSSVSMLITFELRTRHIDLFRLSAIWDENGGPLSASNTSSDVAVRRRKRFSRNRCPLSPWLIVRPRHSGPRLTAIPVYVCIYSAFTPTPRWEVSTELQLCFQSIIGRNSSTNSTFIGSQSINQFLDVWTPDSCSPRRDTTEKLVSGKLDFHWFPVDQWVFEGFGPRIRVPRVEIPQKRLFPASSISIGSRRPMGFRGVWVSDSCSPHRDCSEKLVSGQVGFHWSPVDQWVFEVFGSRIHLPGVEIPQKNLFPANSISIGYRRPMGFRGVWARGK